uniref:Low-density lipoprotein receptor domain class A n=1 Tax=Meloidogyne hapla TaxID=6305 RepID=A0A1I8BEN1_MELHA
MQAKAKQLEEERLKKEKDKEGQCGPEEVPCPETATIRCIHYTSLCDNVDDCGDGYDESNCVSSESRDEEKIITISPENVINAYCAPGEFQCRDGSCIPDSSRCNRNYDCGLTDGSDEEGCAYWKEAEEAERRRKEEEQKQLAEYHEQQRQRAEEEKNRRIEECRRRGGFLCPGQDKCVERSNVCDGRSDCANGDDEKNCPVSEEETGWFINFI